MKNSFLILLFLFSTANAGTDSLQGIRNLYKQASTDEFSCKQLLSNLDRYNEEINPLMAGYKASATMMMANYVWNPIAKLSCFNEGKNLLEKCITRVPRNIELRFLRLSIQQNAPSFLNYNGNIDGDKSFIIQTVGTLKDTHLQKIILDYLTENGKLTAAEKQHLNL